MTETGSSSPPRIVNNVVPQDATPTPTFRAIPQSPELNYQIMGLALILPLFTIIILVEMKKRRLKNHA